MAIAKLTSIRSMKKEIRPLGESIDLILGRIKSKNTAKNYKGFYKEFFTYTLNKQYNDVTWDELLSVTYDDVLEYVGALEVKNNPKTVSTKIASLQSLVKELKKINHDLNTDVFNVKIDTKNVKKNEYGAFTEEEVYKLLDYAKNLKSDKAYVQYMFFRLALCTAHRVSALLSLTWNDIILKTENDKQIWCLDIHDKTNYFLTPISDELYKELREMYNGNDDEKVLKITDKTLSRTLASFCKEYNIDKDGRNLVLHSLKKVSADIVYRISNGDIVKVADHLHHSNINTAYRAYLQKNKKLSDSHSYIMFNEQESVEESLGDLSKEQLLELIKSCSNITIQEICNKAKKMK